MSDPIDMTISHGLEVTTSHGGTWVSQPRSQRKGFGRFVEYTSDAKVWKFPLVHMSTGVDPRTGKWSVAKGVIAVGNFAIGLVSVGMVALGLLVLAQFGLGAFVIAQVAVGIAAVGQFVLSIVGVAQFIVCVAGVGQFIVAKHKNY